MVTQQYLSIKDTMDLNFTSLFSTKRSFNTLKHYIGTQNGVLIIEVSSFRRVAIQRFNYITKPLHMYIHAYTGFGTSGI